MKTLSITLALLLTTCHMAVAQSQTTNCAPRPIVIERLGSEYGETRQAIALAGNNQILEVFASLETGTWTITVTTPAGLTCLVASGESYQDVSEETTPDGDEL